ncbi:hypothetical protein O181_011683 [Austropuccinia psidii MF-1]|uniref:Uncharacterized protein n=1 Tax=Austropuccinia psidii MF-1 TaxID=1389203 RepID=A0A9Q3GLI0_9BASI|nr:hypothetical protein [Austropuccinia psidii MF-1]
MGSQVKYNRLTSSWSLSLKNESTMEVRYVGPTLPLQCSYLVCLQSVRLLSHFALRPSDLFCLLFELLCL